MGLFEKIFGSRRPQMGRAEEWFRSLTTYQPSFTNWNGELYESELVRSAIDARARHVSKLSITINGSAKPKMQTRLRKQPNEWQTWGQMLYRTSTILDMQGTCFVVPIYDEYGQVTGIYPVLPSRCEMVQHGGVPWLRYSFQTGDKAALRLSECGILVAHQYKDDFFGSDNRALIDTMEMIHLQHEAVNEAVKNSNSYRFMAQLTNFAKPADLAEERKRFTAENFRRDEGSGGLLLFPNTYGNIQQIKSTPYVVDNAQMELIKTNVFNYFGVNEEILQNKAYGDAWSAFYEGAVEAFSIQFSEVVTRMLFTDIERSNGCEIFLTANRLQYMSTQEKLNVSSQLFDRGILNRDDVREIWNLPPLPNGEGQTYAVLAEYVNAADQVKGDNTNANET